MQIGIAGIGKMGAAIAQRVMEVGHTITVWNRSPEKTKPIAAAGAAVAATPAELASKSEAIITSLTDAAAIDAVYGGASGLLAAALCAIQCRSTLVVMYSISANITSRSSDSGQRRVSNTTSGASAGTVVARSSR